MRFVLQPVCGLEQNNKLYIFFSMRHCIGAPMHSHKMHANISGSSDDIIMILIIMSGDDPCGREEMAKYSLFHFLITQILLKTHFDRKIYVIVSCFVCVSGRFAAVQYIGDINSNPRWVQKVHTHATTYFSRSAFIK